MACRAADAACRGVTSENHLRCWPPSSAIIWPVMAGASRMKRTALAISAGLVPRLRMVEAASASNSSGLWWMLRSAGPGPMALTRIRGPSACASIRVAVHSADFDSE